MLKNRKLFILIMIYIILLSLIGCQNNQSKQQHNQSQKKNQPKDKANNIIIKPTPNYTYTKMKKQLNKLTKNYDQLKVSSIGKSLADRKLYLLTLGNGNKKIAVIGGVHGRESMTSLLVLRLIEDYAKHFEANKNIKDYNLKDLLNQVTFYFIPMLNPDGVEIAINGIKNLKNKNFYIKANEGNSNFKRWKANGRGVDLNKQFNADWNRVDSTDKPHFSDYKGSRPESEPESQALAQLTRKEKFNTVIAFHHSGNIIYWYYNQTGQNYKNDYQLAKKIHAKNNYKLIEPEESDTKAAGYKDWFIKEFNKPGFTIEIGTKKIDKPLPSYNLDKYFKDNREVLLEVANNI